MHQDIQLFELIQMDPVDRNRFLSDIIDAVFILRGQEKHRIDHCHTHFPQFVAFADSLHGDGDAFEIGSALKHLASQMHCKIQDLMNLFFVKHIVILRLLFDKNLSLQILDKDSISSLFEYHFAALFVEVC